MQNVPWLIIRCKFKDDPAITDTFPTEHYAALFTASDIENVLTYFRDISYGEINMEGSEVTPWLTLDGHYTAKEGGEGQPGKGRRELIAKAKQAAIDAGNNLGRFFGVAINLDRGMDLFGSAEHYAVCDTLSSLSQISQEVGHGFGLEHSRAVANPTDYENPFCIMSGMRFGEDLSIPGNPSITFPSPTFIGRFGDSGPGLCSPLLFKAGWLTENRIVHVTCNGRTPAPTVITLSPLGEMNPHHPQVVMFNFNTPQDVMYFVEYRAGGWDRGLVQNSVVVHQHRPDGIAYYAGSIGTSTRIGTGASDDFTLLPGTSYIDPMFDLSVLLLSTIDNDGEHGSVKIKIASAAAAGSLSVRAIARAKLDIANGISIKSKILQNGSTSVRESLVELLSR